jgi:hypothetical protein
MNGHRINNSYPPFPPADKLRNALFARAKSDPTTSTVATLSVSRFEQDASSLIKPHSNVPEPPASPGRSVTVGEHRRTHDPAAQLSLSNQFDVAAFANWAQTSQTAPEKGMITAPLENGGGTVPARTVAENPIQVKQEKTPKRLASRNDREANSPVWTADLAQEVSSIYDSKYARASPSAGWAGRRAVPFAPDRAASPPCFAAAARAALRRAPECAAAGWEPPCATVGWSGT